ncbi:hypothetical protein PJF56_12825 [Roseofilum sp. BLCC_M91]|uniref:Uncharacterized protein n=1 Tax=Roseofilum halophilum BLCC-M91 TaxID=3022259 RepID=A0ABT7BMH5_9CYAN|nr:hypothetical protein [Roseofilum halophilum]MDJ1179749.1 hypothetical protein [Roseofilum halophilum BLCC-M91]
MRWFALIGWVGLGMLMTPMARAQSTSVDPVYPEQAVTDILDNCQQQTAQFLPPDLIEPLCQCVLTQFQAEFSYGDYEQLIDEAEKTGEDPPQFSQIGRKCALEQLI